MHGDAFSGSKSQGQRKVRPDLCCVDVYGQAVRAEDAEREVGARSGLKTEAAWLMFISHRVMSHLVI